MKRMSKKPKLFSYLILSGLFIGSLLLYSPDNIALSASGAPEIAIIAPDDGSVFDVSKVEFTGKITDDVTSPDKLTVKVLEQQNNSDKPIDITGEGKLTVTTKDQSLEFSYSKEFSGGTHTLSFIVTDADHSTGEVTKTFTVKKAEDGQTADPQQTNSKEAESPQKAAAEKATANKAAVIRPLSSANTTHRPYVTDMNLIKDLDQTSSYLPAEDMTQVPLEDQIMVVVRSYGSLTKYQPLLEVSTNKGEKVTGIEKLAKTTQLPNNMKEYLFTFTPGAKLKASTTYYIYVNPEVTNDSGKNIIPVFVKFTTINNNHLNDIHGNYTNNTNACGYCHSTHSGKTDTLQGGKYGAASDNYCMACHDGTNGSPMPDQYSTNNQHSQFENSDSCTSCHNPHASWTKENPNRLQSTSVEDTSGTHFETYSFKKSRTATGQADDFSLCFSCHNGKNASNIEQYYKDPGFLSQSGHRITATSDSGSSLHGQLPCAECHETHGSKNLKLLREQLGNVKITDSTKKFNTSGTTWNAENERSFCLTCHTNGTILYGKIATPLPLTDGSGATLSGHQPTSKQSCSYCHGGRTGSFRETAHAPELQ